MAQVALAGVGNTYIIFQKIYDALLPKCKLIVRKMWTNFVPYKTNIAV